MSRRGVSKEAFQWLVNASHVEIWTFHNVMWTGDYL